MKTHKDQVKKIHIKAFIIRDFLVYTKMLMQIIINRMNPIEILQIITLRKKKIIGLKVDRIARWYPILEVVQEGVLKEEHVIQAEECQEWI